MSLKKKPGEKLAQGVRQVQAQRDSAPATPAEAAATDPVIESTPAQAEAQPRAARADNKPTVKNKLHPQRVWPD